MSGSELDSNLIDEKPLTHTHTHTHIKVAFLRCEGGFLQHSNLFLYEQGRVQHSQHKSYSSLFKQQRRWNLRNSLLENMVLKWNLALWVSPENRCTRGTA